MGAEAPRGLKMVERRREVAFQLGDAAEAKRWIGVFRPLLGKPFVKPPCFIELAGRERCLGACARVGAVESWRHLIALRRGGILLGRAHEPVYRGLG